MEQLTIGEVAERVGLRPSALRYYEKVGLLPAAERVSGRRRFGEEVVRRLEMINTAKELGFTLDEAKLLLDGMSAESPPPERWQVVAARKLPEVERLIERALLMKRILRKGLDCECITIEACFAQLEGD